MGDVINLHPKATPCDCAYCIRTRRMRALQRALQRGIFLVLKSYKRLPKSGLKLRLVCWRMGRVQRRIELRATALGWL